MKGTQKIGLACLFLIILVSLLQNYRPQPAIQENTFLPAPKNRRVIRIEIPQQDAPSIVLEGDEAQAYYDKITEETKKRLEEESKFNRIIEKENPTTKGAFYYKYRYLESKHTKDVERRDLEKIVTNKLKNTSSSKQSYSLNLSVSQSWSISPSVSSEYINAIKVALGGSWGNTYSKNETLTINVNPHKTVWVSFYPIMDKSEGKVQKYFIPRNTSHKNLIVEKSYDVVSYNPKFLTSKIGPFTIQTVYGMYIWNEE